MVILALISVGLLAGTMGTLFGVGGGILLIPILTIVFGLQANEAVAVSLVGIIAASTGAASHYVRINLSNVRLGLLLEITTSIGAMMGAAFAMYMENWIILLIFGLVLIYSAVSMIIRKEKIIEQPDDVSDMCFSYTDNKDYKTKRYEVRNVKGGLLACTAAGIMSSMAGVGGGTIKVPLMNIYMHVPMKVASATSSYMMGITAFSGAVVYFVHGGLLLDYASAIAVGAFIGSIAGTRLSRVLNSEPMRKYFSILLLIISVIIFLRMGGIL
jgi:uncharacterized membrane protein YfcA